MKTSITPVPSSTREPTDRKTLIADTAIALLGRLGARGLTHRAVDSQAGLPDGSTSFYCRTRLDLLTLALHRHAALDMADLEADGPAWLRARPSGENLVDLLASRIADWLSPAKRERLVARFELFLIASREPALADVVAQQRQRFLQATIAALDQAGVPRPSTIAPALLAVVDGLLWDPVGAQGPAMLASQRKAALRAVIRQHLKA